MAIEYEIRDGALAWIRNPVTGVVSYVVDVRAKSFAFRLDPDESCRPQNQPLGAEEIRSATESCPFCPGNENLTTPELLRLSPSEVPGWNGAEQCQGRNSWVIRVIRNLFPRIPAQLTGDRNESYIVVEDPRHFVASPRWPGDVMCTYQLSEAHFVKLIGAAARITRQALSNPAVASVVIRKNQGRDSGASQPHIHQQIIGSPGLLPVLSAEMRAERENPGLWGELLELVDRLGLVVDRRGGVTSYVSPIGAFPRSYDVVMPGFRGLLPELSSDDAAKFAGALYRLLRLLGPLPLDYEIHQHRGLPLHAHINARHFPYSNVAGTLNLPSTLLERAEAVRRALARTAD